MRYFVFPLIRGFAPLALGHLLSTAVESVSQQEHTCVQKVTVLQIIVLVSNLYDHSGVTTSPALAWTATIFQG